MTKQARRDAKSLFRSCLANGLLDESRVRKAVKVVVDAKPRGYIRLLAYFKHLVEMDVARRTARVESAVELPRELADDLKVRLDKVYGPGLGVTFAQNPDLIGGLRVSVGSDVYDGSIRGRLNTLAESF